MGREMKKSTTRKSRKLSLHLETVKALNQVDLVRVAGGVTSPCNHPTSTVLPTGDC